MEIQIKNAKEFHTLLETLISELNQAQDHFALLRDLTAAYKDFSREFHQTQTFWHLTRRAHRDAVLIRLCRAYEQNFRSLNLRNLLDTIAANMHHFNEAGFRERLEDNPFVDSLAATARRPDPAQIESDKRLLAAESNPAVEKLITWRHHYVAHRDPKRLLKDTALGENCPLLDTDVQTLLDNGRAIVNRYSILFVAASHANHILGHDDYLKLLQAMREQLDSYDARVQEELRQCNPND